MDLLALGKELAQSALERAASYRPGQAALRHADKALWVLEKSARWAVPPPLEGDEPPQPELVRPLPWLAFLPLLLTMRVARESLSLLNLLLGKPPLRSADVVTYIQGKRRYLRTLKYAGNRAMRARGARRGGGAGVAWTQRLRGLLSLTMCVGGGGSTVQDQVMIVHRNPPTDSDMERLIERMMADVGSKTDDDDDSSYTLTNATSVKSDSEVESELDKTPPHDPATTHDPTSPPDLTTPHEPLPNNNHAMEDRNITEERVVRSNGDSNAAFDVKLTEVEKSAIPQPVDRKNKEPKASNENKDPKPSSETKESQMASSETKDPKASGENKDPKATGENNQKKRSPKLGKFLNLLRFKRRRGLFNKVLASTYDNLTPS